MGIKYKTLCINGKNAPEQKNRILIADNFLLRLRGLLGRQMTDFQGLALIDCNNIHTCFMQYNMDAVYIDWTGTVIKIQPDIPPFRFKSVVWRARTVLELPANRAVELGIKLGDKIEFV